MGEVRTYRNKISGAVVLVRSEIVSEEWEEILAPLSSVSDAKPEKVEEKPKRKTASKKSKK